MTIISPGWWRASPDAAVGVVEGVTLGRDGPTGLRIDLQYRRGAPTVTVKLRNDGDAYLARDDRLAVPGALHTVTAGSQSIGAAFRSVRHLDNLVGRGAPLPDLLEGELRAGPASADRRVAPALVDAEGRLCQRLDPAALDWSDVDSARVARGRAAHVLGHLDADRARDDGAAALVGRGSRCRLRRWAEPGQHDGCGEGDREGARAQVRRSRQRC